MAYDALLKLSDVVEASGYTRPLKVSSNRLHGRVDVNDGSGNLSIRLEHSSDGESYKPLEFRPLQGVIGKLKGEPIDALEITGPIRNQEFWFKIPSSGFIRYSFEATSTISKGFEIEINHQ